MSSFEELASSASWFAITPQLFLLITVFVVLGYDMAASPKTKDVHAFFVMLGIASTGAAVVAQHSRALDGVLGNVLSFSNMLRLDGTSILTNGALLLVLALGLVFAWPMITDVGTRGAETIALMMLSTVGFMLMASSANLMMLFIGLEIGSISLYVLAGIAREKTSADEASVKYFLLGSFASAIFVYGVALYYAATGSVSLTDITTVLVVRSIPSLRWRWSPWL